MPEQANDQRKTSSETFGYAGCTVELVDADTILAAAGAGPVELLRGAAFPEPVRQVHLSIIGTVRELQQVHLLNAEIRTHADGLSTERVRALMLGNDPLGVLLARRIAAGDQWATKVVDGVGNAAVTAYRRLGLERRGRPGGGAGPAVLADAAAGLQATVTYEEGRTPGEGTAIRLRASVPSADVSPAHLRAMVGLVLQMVVELMGEGAGPDPLAGRRYVLQTDHVAPTAKPSTTQTVTLDQVGGLADVVAELRQIATSFRHPEAMARWGARRPQGILMYGPPGTGKTMLSRALANEIGATFREIRTPEILDKWLGGSERNIKRIFREARRYREPTLILFDEFDSIISYAGAGGDAASQAINAVAGIFKQEMNDLIEENPNVIIVATTNFPQRVDESLIRSGRFDIKLAIPLPDQVTRTEIFRKMIGQLSAVHESPGFRMFADDLDLPALAAASPGMTGADIKEVLRRVQLTKAMLEARTGGPVPPITQQELRESIADLAGGVAPS